MPQLSVSYGILPNDKPSNNNPISHILPITKIISLPNAFLSTSRDGSIIWHDLLNKANNLKLQIHSDWISDILQLNPSPPSSHLHHHHFISVSHDFSINLIHIIPSENNSIIKAEAKIIGYHQDYIKAIKQLNNNTFVTVGLDNYTNLWAIDISTHSSSHLLKSFYHPLGSLYSLQCVQQSHLPFDIVVADCNGNIIFYHSMKDQPVKTILNAHDTNIKSIKLFLNNTRLLSTCSNGVVKVWDLSNYTLLSQFNWQSNSAAAVIWSIERDDTSPQTSFIVADSKGNISSLQFNQQNHNHTTTPLYSTQNTHTNKHNGILTAIKTGNLVRFAYCSNSNLNTLNTHSNNLQIEQGGIALTRSSLLTNRRHVITENSMGIIQQWDIISCQLINTFPRGHTSFEECVKKYTSHEILPHWCTVSIKVGVLFIKITAKNFNNTEVYGNALNDYTLLNTSDNKDVSAADNSLINEEYRYNLGKIVINSLFHEFMTWEIDQDIKFRSQLVANFDHTQQHTHPKQQKKKSTFPNLSLSTSHFKSNNNTPFVSAPSTPMGELNDLPNDFNKMVNVHHKSHDDLLNSSNDNNTTNNNSRAMSSGSIFTRKFRALRNSSKTTNKDTSSLSNSTNLERPHTTSGTPINTDSQIDFNYNIFKSTNNSHHSLPESSTSSLASSSSSSALSSPPPPPPAIPSHSNASLPSTSQPLPLETNNSESKEFMSDLINNIHDSYSNQLQNQNQSSLTKFNITKRKIDSLIKKDDNIPIIKINSKTLLLVQSWNEGACGGKVLFSTVLPMSRSTSASTSLPNNLSSTSLISTTSSISSLDSSLDTTSLSSQNSNVSLTSSKTSSNKRNLITKKHHHGNKKLFTKIERNLPYWIGELLCQDNNLVQEKQPRLNFIILPWTSEEQQDSIGDVLPQPHPQQQHHHHHHPGFKLGKSKSNELIKSSMTDLPKISESNIKLIAPGMVKVKKIKNYVVDRFESRTPEMKEKLDPSLWLELLCKDQLLDNDMTLSTVRTLFWKSQGEIKIYYRRKVTI